MLSAGRSRRNIYPENNVKVLLRSKLTERAGIFKRFVVWRDGEPDVRIARHWMSLAAGKGYPLGIGVQRTGSISGYQHILRAFNAV